MEYAGYRFIISSHTKFHPNRTKTKVRNFQCWLVLVGRAGRMKNGHRHFKRILSCCCSIFSPHTKFNPNRTKNTEVSNFHFWSILVGRLQNGCRHIKLILCCFCPIISPHKTYKLEIFTFGRLWLVGRKMVVSILNSFYVVFAPLLAPKPNFI